MSRLKFLFSWGAKYAVFEDNYPVGEGDAYSIRKIKSCTGQSLNEWFKSKQILGSCGFAKTRNQKSKDANFSLIIAYLSTLS